MQRTIVLGTLLLVGMLSLTVAAMRQAPAAQTPNVVQVEKLAENLYVGKGGGGNSSIFVTATGVVVVDTKLPGWGQPLIDAIRTVTDKPVTTIINTHTHADHVSGNVEFSADADIVAHENTAANMRAMRPNSTAPQTPAPNIFTANNGKGLPKRTFSDSMTLGSGNDRVELHYFGRAHTNGDAVVYFPSRRVAHVADIYPADDFPIMDANNGGSAVEFADTLSKALAFTEKNADALVNGHRDRTSTNAELKGYIGFIRGFVSYAQDAKRAGKSVDDAVAGWKPPAGFTAQPARVRNGVQLAFAETK